ncbi:MAG: PilN domain-containing protein [Pseudomonadales bacterium]
MTQRINLYQASISDSVWRTYSPFPQIAIGLLLVMLALTVLASLDKTKSEAELQRLTAQHDQIAAQVAILNAPENREVSEVLQKEVLSLETRLNTRQSVLEGIKAEGVGNGAGFSSYMEGLARQHFEGLWLTSFELQQGGERMALKGVTDKPEWVPRYIRSLGNESVFAGTEFNVFSLEKSDKGAALVFDVAAVLEASK